MLRMNTCEYMNNYKNEYMGNVNVRSECGNVRSECFDRCNLMLRINIWGMNMRMLMLGMLGSFNRCKYMNVCN